MGDDCCNPDSMGRVTELIKSSIPGVYVHSIQIGNTVNSDHKAGFFGRINDQIESVCDQLKKIPELEDGFNAIGFSQGGLMLRGYVEKCNYPPVHNLITFGSPHGGVSDIPNCMTKDYSCRLMRSMVHRGVYTQYIQNTVIQAQYYRDPTQGKLGIQTHTHVLIRLLDYLHKNLCLPLLNNEIHSNITYRNNIIHLNKLVLIQFSQDTMIKPPSTAWFWIEDEEHRVIPIEEQEVYKQDVLGLKTLRERGSLHYLVCPGQHMEISDDYLMFIIHTYLKDASSLRMIAGFQ
ncbi:Alpha/Beta hydrolase protein [Pilobolus umbonatus]|nr:Alpha/Beta hydrolase protein [Pilobolus umbonatus]